MLKIVVRKDTEVSAADKQARSMWACFWAWSVWDLSRLSNLLENLDTREKMSCFYHEARPLILRCHNTLQQYLTSRDTTSQSALL